MVGNWQIDVVNVTDELRENVLPNPDPYQAWADADQIRLPLELRTRLPGDRIEILGMDGQHTKLSDIFINRKIPRRVRSNWPLLVSGETIIWVPGVQLAQSVRLTGATRARPPFYVNPSLTNFLEWQ